MEGLDKRIYELRNAAIKDGEPILREKTFEYLLNLVKEKRLNNVLEIGVNCGLTSTSVLLINKDAKVTGIEISEDVAKKAKENYKTFGVEGRAKLFIGDACEIMPVLSGEFDLIFIDGPKGHYHEFIESALPLLKVGGIIFADNVLFRGYVREKVKTPHRFNTAKHSLETYLKRVSESKNLKTEIIDIEDGFAVTEKLYEEN